MKKITLVERQKKNKNRFNIYLDGEFAFGADEDTVVNLRLLRGKEIADLEIEKIFLETEIGKIMDRLYGLFSKRQRTEQEVRDYLRNLSFKRKLKDQEEISDFIVEQVIRRLSMKGYLNDLEFAHLWIQARQNSKKKGRIAIRSELLQKGVAQEVVDEAIDLQTSVETEKKLAVQALAKKVHLIKDLSNIKLKQKALRFLVSKGFTYEIAKETVEYFIKYKDD